MTPKLKRLYLASRADKEFMKHLEKHEPDYAYTTIAFFMSDRLKTIIAMIYMGYLIGIGKYNESDYEI